MNEPFTLLTGGSEAIQRHYMLQAVDTGPKGSYATLHGTHERFRLALTPAEAKALKPLTGQIMRLTLEPRPNSNPPPRVNSAPPAPVVLPCHTKLGSPR